MSVDLVAHYPQPWQARNHIRAVQGPVDPDLPAGGGRWFQRAFEKYEPELEPAPWGVYVETVWERDAA